MTKTSELAHVFRALKTPAAARALPKLADRAREEHWSYERLAEALLSSEVASRDSHGGETRIKAARFPARKTTAAKPRPPACGLSAAEGPGRRPGDHRRFACELSLRREVPPSSLDGAPTYAPGRRPTSDGARLGAQRSRPQDSGPVAASTVSGATIPSAAESAM
jgi:hypothetical protein